MAIASANGHPILSGATEFTSVEQVAHPGSDGIRHLGAWMLSIVPGFRSTQPPSEQFTSYAPTWRQRIQSEISDTLASVRTSSEQYKQTAAMVHPAAAQWHMSEAAHRLRWGTQSLAYVAFEPTLTFLSDIEHASGLIRLERTVRHITWALRYGRNYADATPSRLLSPIVPPKSKIPQKRDPIPPPVPSPYESKASPRLRQRSPTPDAPKRASKPLREPSALGDALLSGLVISVMFGEHVVTTAARKIGRAYELLTEPRASRRGDSTPQRAALRPPMYRHRVPPTYSSVTTQQYSRPQVPRIARASINELAERAHQRAAGIDQQPEEPPLKPVQQPIPHPRPYVRPAYASAPRLSSRPTFEHVVQSGRVPLTQYAIGLAGHFPSGERVRRFEIIQPEGRLVSHIFVGSGLECDRSVGSWVRAHPGARLVESIRIQSGRVQT